MHTSLVILDNFYNDPLQVREMALKMDYEVKGNFPGARTKPVFNQSVYDLIERTLEPNAGKITWWDRSENSYTGSFQYTTSRNRSWIHADQTTTWAGVLYLTPDAPLSGGTGLFRHKATGLEMAPRTADGKYDMELLAEVNKDSQDMTKWEMTDFVGNKFNRLVMYRGDYFHTSMDYFGQNMYDGRLFQTFFFNTER